MADDTRYKDRNGGTFIHLASKHPDVEVPPPPDQVDGTIGSGNGLTGGGKQSTNPMLHVGQGWGIQVNADDVAVHYQTLDGRYQPYPTQGAVSITDWNQAVLNNTVYMASSAANGPDTGWFYGWCLSHNSVWHHQFVIAFANGRQSSGQLYERECENGVWGDWNRVESYVHGRDLSDSGTWIQHNASGSSMGIRRAFHGMIKDKATGNASNIDEWRVQFYNTGGTFVGSAIKIPLGTGAVSMPYSAMTAQQLAGEEAVSVDMVATIGTVAEMVLKALDRLGLLKEEVTPAQLMGLMLYKPEPETEKDASRG